MVWCLGRGDFCVRSWPSCWWFSEVTHELWHVGCPEYSSWVHSWLSGMRWRGMNQRIASILRVGVRAWWLIPNAELLTPCTNLLDFMHHAKDAERRGDGPLATKAPALSNASPVQGPGRLVRSTLFSVEIFSGVSVFRKVWDTAPIFVWNSGLWCFRFISSSNVYVYILLGKGLRFRSLIIFHSKETDLVLPRLPNASLSQSIEGKEGKWLP